MNMKNRLTQPTDPYDTPAWMAFYAANPGFRRSVGAEGVNDDDPAPGADDDPQDPPKGADDDPQDPPKGDDDPKDPPKGDDKDKKPSDEEARLLQDLMKHKKAAREAQAKLKDYDGVDVEEYKRLKQASADAAQAELEAKGQFDEVKRQMREAHDQEITTIRAESEEKDKTIAELKAQIEELTVGSSFGSSKFLKEETLLPPSKARRLYGEHFEIEDGKVVAYDKPKGAANRSPLVDGRGDPLPFEDAISKIFKADPDSKEMLRSALRPGSDSDPSNAKSDPAKDQKPMSRQEKIASGLSSLFEGGNQEPFSEMFNTK